MHLLYVLLGNEAGYIQDPKKQMLEEKEEEGMGTATIRYGETDAFIQHIKTQLWLSYQVSYVYRKFLTFFFAYFWVVLLPTITLYSFYVE